MTEPLESNLGPGLRRLAEIVDRLVPKGENHVRQGPLWALRFDHPTTPSLAIYGPMLCVVAQGAKQLLVGDERLVYDPGRVLLNTLALPASGGVVEATPAQPCLWVMVELDPSMIVEVVLGSGLSEARPATPLRALDTTAIDPALLDAVVRLACLFESPDDAEFLRPLLLREIVYRLLRGGQGVRLRQIVGHSGPANRIVQAVEWLRQNYEKPMTVEGLAQKCGLSPSALHRNFKSVTAMSPLRFQKQMRLQEARRLMVGEGLDAATAGYRVGYEDPSYFSRDYRRFFGEPPRRHVARVLDGIL